MHVWVDGHLQDITGDMCQDLHCALINTIFCFTSLKMSQYCGIGCDFLIFEMLFHGICILILHHYLKRAEKSFEKYNCLICEQHNFLQISVCKNHKDQRYSQMWKVEMSIWCGLEETMKLITHQSNFYTLSVINARITNRFHRAAP